MKISPRVILMLCGLTVLLIGNTASAAIDCECRDPTGNMRSIGFVQCIDINGSKFLARCEMSTNTPFWSRLTDSGCPSV